MREGDDALRIEERDLAQAVAARARAHGVVEGEEARLELRNGVAADRAGELRGEQVFLPGARRPIRRPGLHCDRTSVGMPERGLERFGEALALPSRLVPVGRFHFQAIDHDLDRVLPVLVELGQVVDLVHLAVDAQPHEALGAQFIDELELLALAAHHERREDHHALAFLEREDVVHHLRDALRLQRDVVLGTIRIAHAREEQAQVVVDLGHGSHGGTRVVRGGLLLDGDRGGKALDQVHVGLLHELEELPRVRGERFHVAALAFGVERVERERGFARARKARDHDKLVARNIDTHIPEIVRARAANSDRFHGAIC